MTDDFFITRSDKRLTFQAESIKVPSWFVTKGSLTLEILDGTIPPCVG